MSGAALALIGALLALGILALALLFYLGTIRVPMVMKGDVRIRDIALNAGWPDRARQAANAFDNQFQLPVLFAIGSVVALQFGPTLLEAIIAWLFVIARVVHAGIHVTDNHVVRRFSAYVAGLVLLCLFWLDLLVRFVLTAIGAP